MTKQQLLQELASIGREITTLTHSFRGIKKKARGVYATVISKNDQRKVEEMRKRIGL